jgi:thioredoxin-like negative regulator of GroEL
MVEATKDNFKDLVADGVTLVDVWGPSCQPCIAMMPEVEKLAAEKAPDVRVVKLEAPKARRLCMEYKIMGLPAFLLFNDGEEVSRLAGAEVTFGDMRRWLDENLATLGSQPPGTQNGGE